MRRHLFAILAVLAAQGPGCASAPKPKQPDQSRRTPVNVEVPAELRQGRDAVRPAKNDGELEWR